MGVQRRDVDLPVHHRQRHGFPARSKADYSRAWPCMTKAACRWSASSPYDMVIQRRDEHDAVIDDRAHLEACRHAGLNVATGIIEVTLLALIWSSGRKTLIVIRAPVRQPVARALVCSERLLIGDINVYQKSQGGTMRYSRRATAVPIKAGCSDRKVAQAQGHDEGRHRNEGGISQDFRLGIPLVLPPFPMFAWFGVAASSVLRLKMFDPLQFLIVGGELMQARGIAVRRKQIC